MRILGFIDKIGKNYQWIYDTDEPRIKTQAPEIKKQRTNRLKRSQLN